MTADHAKHRGPTLGGSLSTLAEAAVVALGIAYVVTEDLEVLLVWEGVAIVYLAAGLVVVLRQAYRGSTADRTGVLGALSWVLPLAASVVGVYSAFVVLVPEASASPADTYRTVVAAIIAIVLSWLLLQVGMAQSYQALRAGRDGGDAFEFPATENPLLLDFLYFSFAIGTAFATSDTRVRSRLVRLRVIIHSTLSFFYNAFVIAVAFQALQEVVRLRG